VGSGAWCYAQTLREMGHEVVECDDQGGLEQYRRSTPWRVFRKLRRGIWEAHRRRHAQLLADAVRKHRPEITIILKGLHISAADVSNLRHLGTWVVNLNHDDFFSRNPNNWTRIQRGAIPQYDCILTTREVNLAEIQPINPRVRFLGFAYYPRIHRPMVLEPHERQVWASDVVFVGTWEAERCRLLEQLVREVPARYAIYGEQWERVSRHSPLRPYVHRSRLGPDDMAKAIGGAKLALGFLRKENRDEYTQRSFEIPAYGGLLVAERTALHCRLYKEGVEAVFFDSNSGDELATAVTLLLSDPERREKIRRAGMDALHRQRHTYEDRMNELLELYRSSR